MFSSATTIEGSGIRTCNFQPRIGLAYRLGDKTVLRSGWSIYTVPFVIDGSNQAGFSQATNLVPSNDTGVSFVANLANPVPGGVADPPGSSLGLANLPRSRLELRSDRPEKRPGATLGAQPAARVAGEVDGGGQPTSATVATTSRWIAISSTQSRVSTSQPATCAIKRP